MLHQMGNKMQLLIFEKYCVHFFHWETEKYVVKSHHNSEIEGT